MNPIKLVCDGITVGSVVIPPFQLASKEIVCLHLPGPCTFKEHSQILQTLTGKRPLAGVRLFGKVSHAEIPALRAGFFGLFRRPQVVYWLRRSAGISTREAEAILVRLGLDPSWSISQLAMNPRTLLGLEAAWARGADVVVFSTSGCDPAGVRLVYEAVMARLDRSAALRLSYPFLHNGHEQRECFPGAQCLSATRLQAPPKMVAQV